MKKRKKKQQNKARGSIVYDERNFKKIPCAVLFSFFFSFSFFFVFCSQQNVNILVVYVVYVARARPFLNIYRLICMFD